LTVIPNPATTQIVVNHPKLGTETAMVRIYTTGGSLVLSYPVEAGAADNNSVVVDVSLLAAGMYVVRVFNASTTIVKQ
jgi:hypothetical protein